MAGWQLLSHLFGVIWAAAGGASCPLSTPHTQPLLPTGLSETFRYPQSLGWVPQRYPSDDGLFWAGLDCLCLEASQQEAALK